VLKVPLNTKQANKQAPMLSMLLRAVFISVMQYTHVYHTTHASEQPTSFLVMFARVLDDLCMQRHKSVVIWDLKSAVTVIPFSVTPIFHEGTEAGRFCNTSGDIWPCNH